MTRVVLVALLLALSGCEHGSAPADPEPQKASSSELMLGGLLPDDALLVGVTIAPDGKRYVLDQRSGLYEVEDTRATLVFNTTGLGGVVLTDVVALDADRFALTAENDGFLFDARTKAFSSYFCYLPPSPTPPVGVGGSGGSQAALPSTPISISQTLQLDGIAVKQRTESVAFNPDTRQLFAQPLTTRLDTGAVAGSELFVFTEGGGQPIQVLPFAQTSFVAGGMVAAPGNRLLLGGGSAIFEATLDGGFNLLRQLDASIEVTGMARGPSGEVWVLDGAERRLVRLDGTL